ncbi:hypothetical protein EI94DRAFT_1700161 [Lactarius quietus]|nr:hypothetical protein EI94DRAFT_1700161 [Lactarius quietus]
MEVLYCICPNTGEKDEQLFQSGMFPSSFKQIETAFTFSALEEFLTDNLECKTMAQQYFSKLQGITNWMFPHTVPNLYRQLLRASRQWRDLRNRMQSSLGHQDEDGIDGSMAIFCPACPQPGINLPDHWKIRYNEYGLMIFMTMNQLVRTFIMDGNFAAEHMQCRSGDKDVPLSPGMAFMANPEAYKIHLKSSWESIQPSTCNTYKAIEQANSSIGATACCHGFFVPTSVVDFQKGERQVNMDYSLCKALSYNMEDIPVALVMYDIMCQYGVHLSDRVEKSPELSIANSLELRTGIGLFHIHGHQDSCLPRFSPSYITGAKQVDGEIIETLSRSSGRLLYGYDYDIPSLLKRWKRMKVGMDLSADTFNSLTKRLKKHTKRWLKSERNAQLNRSSDSTVMDIYDTVTVKVMLMHKVAPSLAEIQQKLILEESGDPTTHGQTSWIASGIRIQELQLAIKYQLRTSGTNITTDATVHIDNKRTHLQRLVDTFQHQADSFILAHSHVRDSTISHMGTYDVYDNVDYSEMMRPTDPEHSSHSLDQPLSLSSDSSGMDSPNPEDLPILLSSSLGWNWICLALGFKSALFRTQVRSANTQQTKTHAWTAISSVDTTAHPDALELPTLTPQDLHVATLVLGSDKPGQCNTQQSWIWSFGQTSEDEGTWMDDFERVHWLRAKAQFEHWLEEQQSIHDEAQWVPTYFHAKAEAWKKLVVFTVKGICIISGAHVGAAGSKISKGTFSDYP